MEELSKENCYTLHQTGDKTQYQCKICGRFLSRKQRMLTHLNKKHSKSPLKRVYQQYKEDPTIPIPKRTSVRHSSARQSLLGAYSHMDTSLDDIDFSFNQDSDEDYRSQEPYGADEQSSLIASSQSNQEPYGADEQSSLIASSQSNQEPYGAGEQSSLIASSQSNQEPYGADEQSSLIASSQSNQEPYGAGEQSRPTIDLYSDDDLDSDSGSSSYVASDIWSSTESDSEQSDSSIYQSHDEIPHDSNNETHYSESELNILCLMSYFLRHNSSGVAIKDLLQLLPILYPGSNLENITYEKVMLLAGESNCKTVHYCSICSGRFSVDPVVFRCATTGCNGYRYKGPLSSQQKQGRQPRSGFVLADVKKQLQYMFERKGTWDSVQYTKNKVKQDVPCEQLTDIVDGQFYRNLCQPGQFLDSSNNVTALFNTDGIPLYNSSNVKLWPIFLAINELPPASRFARENMILAAIWQGKNKPPFSQYMCAFGEEMSSLYEDGLVINPPGLSAPLTCRMGVFLATMDLQAKGYVLNMTMHNGQFGCSTCEEQGESVTQGKGYARHYPYRPSQGRPDTRESDDIKYVKGPNASSKKRIKGICGMTGLAVMPWLDVVLGVVPDYMHCVLLGVTKSLMYKFFSSTNSAKQYFVGRHIKKVSKRLQNIQPPDYIERMPRDLEKNYTHFKATELQTWLLFYAIPCLNGYLEEAFLSHLALLSEGIHLLLGDHISEMDLQRAEMLLDSFYQQFSTLYGKGSCGLNVHNIGAHMVLYVRMWGPLWAWSCFAFEDWNAALLQSMHGTGDVTKQCLRIKEIQLKLSCIDLDAITNLKASSYLVKMKQHGKPWSVDKAKQNVSVAGTLRTIANLPEENIEALLRETGSPTVQSLKKALRVKIKDQKLYSEEYTRMKKRVCYVVRCTNGDIRKIMFYLVNTSATRIFAYAKKVKVHEQSFVCENGPHHIIRVMENDETVIFPVEDIVEKVFFMQIDGLAYVACMPNMIGHSVFK